MASESAAVSRSIEVHGKDSTTRQRAIVLALVLLLAGVYTGLQLRVGWIPVDDGTLAQSAARVLQGQLPHRDFVDIYTGGLAFLDAAAFRLFGVNLFSLRLMSLLFFLPCLAAVNYICLRFTSPLVAGGLTLLAAVWSLPNYPSGMPSWYNLYFAIYGAAALLRYVETGGRRWVFTAGVCGGLSLLVKAIGAYYIAAALLFFVFVEQEKSGAGGGEASRWGWYRAFTAVWLLSFLFAVIYVMRWRLGSGEIFDFVLPQAAICFLLLYRERGLRPGSAERFRCLLGMLLPFMAGIALPILIFLVPYAATGSLHTFFPAVSSSVGNHIVALSVARPSAPWHAISSLALVLLLVVAAAGERMPARAVRAAAVMAAALLIGGIVFPAGAATAAWEAGLYATPLLVVAGAWLLSGRGAAGVGTLRRSQVALLLAVAGVGSLVQFPYFAPMYFMYSAPLVLLAALAICSTQRLSNPARFIVGSLGILFFLIAVLEIVPNRIFDGSDASNLPLQQFELPRAGGIRVKNARGFEELARVIATHATNGKLLAGSECPQCYFLSGTAPVLRDDTSVTPQQFLDVIAGNDINVVVITTMPVFPGDRVPQAVEAAINRRFPHSQPILGYRVYWRH